MNCQASRIIACHPQLNSSHCQTFSLLPAQTLLRYSPRCKEIREKRHVKNLFLRWKIQLKKPRNYKVPLACVASGDRRNFFYVSFVAKVEIDFRIPFRWNGTRGENGRRGCVQKDTRLGSRARFRAKRGYRRCDLTIPRDQSVCD